MKLTTRQFSAIARRRNHSGYMIGTVSNEGVLDFHYQHINMRDNRLPDYVGHIRQAATDVCSFIEGLEKGDFLADMPPEAGADAKAGINAEVGALVKAAGDAGANTPIAVSGVDTV